MRILIKPHEISEVVDPARQRALEQVFFGATVTYAGRDDTEHTVKIVGVDEARSELGEITWVSPLARALMKAREGDTVTVRTPAGPVPVEIVRISYGED